MRLNNLRKYNDNFWILGQNLYRNVVIYIENIFEYNFIINYFEVKNIKSFNPNKKKLHNYIT